MENKSKVLAIFTDTVTDKAIDEIKAKHVNLVHDFSNEEEFKAARKVNTEMNKLLKNIDRVGIDAARQVADLRSALKEKVEDAYSGTVTPWAIENQRRKDEQKRIYDERNARILEQSNILNMIKGASARAMYLNHDEIECILQDVMSINLGYFDDDMKQEAKTAKEISLAQLKNAFENASEKEEARKLAEIKEAELADKDDEIEELKRQLSEMQGTTNNDKQIEAETIKDELEKWCNDENICDDYLHAILNIIVKYIPLNTTEKKDV